MKNEVAPHPVLAVRDLDHAPLPRRSGEAEGIAYTTGDGGRAPEGWAEVRVLGPLRVRLADGTVVGERDWRTGKNADLLRWLALHVGAPVPVDVLADGLWPETDQAKSRSSLRTAVAHLRRVLGPEIVQRQGEGLVLTSCWVDAQAFLRLAEDTERHRRATRHVETYGTALEADALYLADVAVAAGTPGVVADRSVALRTVHHRLLGDAAEAALTLGWCREAIELARRLTEADPVDERASRVLMLALAGTGEVSHALAEYERCRRVLADELGVDPSPQTRAAHLRVLRPSPSDRPAPPFVGRRSELAWFQEALAHAVAATQAHGSTPTVLVRGAPGSGRRRLVQAACRAAGLRVAPVRADEPLTDALDEAVELFRRTEARGGATQVPVVVWQPDLPTDLTALSSLLRGPTGGAPAPVVVVVSLPSEGEDPGLDAHVQQAAPPTLHLQPMLRDEVAELAAHVLKGPPTDGLVEELHRQGAGLPGAVLTRLRDWHAAGVLLATSRGVALAPTVVEQVDDPSGRRTLAGALSRMDGDLLEAVQVAALLQEALTPALLAPLLGADPAEVRDATAVRVRAQGLLEQLIDLGLLRGSPSGAVWRHLRMQEAARAWMRPATARRLHARIAARARISSAARVSHWLQAGDRELAGVAALDAAEECAARGDHAGARTHLLAVCSLGDLPGASPEDRADLFEGLGDACEHLRRPEEAGAAYRQALEIALAEMLPRAARLQRKLRSASDPRALGLVPARHEPEQTSALDGFGALSGVAGDPARLEAQLADVIQQADRRSDQRRAVEGRLQMAAAVALPRRDFRGVHQWVAAAGRGAARPSDRLRAVLVSQLTPVLLGGAATARVALEDAAGAAEAAHEDGLWWRLLAMRVLVAHDLGLPEVDSLLTRLTERVHAPGSDALRPELAAVGLRVLAEREETDRATAMSTHLTGAGSGPLLLHLGRLGQAELAEAEGSHRRAVDLLQSVVREGLDTGCTFFVPEAAARVVVLEAEHDPGAARSAFEVYDDVVGAVVGGPREEFWRRMSRAAVRAAAGDADGAASSCSQASQLAARHGLQVMAARARRARASHLRRTRSDVSGEPRRVG